MKKRKEEIIYDILTKLNHFIILLYYMSTLRFTKWETIFFSFCFCKVLSIGYSQKSFAIISSYLWPRTLQQLVQHKRARKDKHPLQLYNNKWTIADQHYDEKCLERIYLVSHLGEFAQGKIIGHMGSMCSRTPCSIEMTHYYNI